MKDDDDDEGFFSIFTSKDQAQKAAQMKTLVQLRSQFNELVTGQCIYCGPHIVESILLPLDFDEAKELSWGLE